MRELWTALAGWIAAGGLSVALFWLITHPDLVDKWRLMLAGPLSKLPGVWRRADKYLQKRGLEERINSFTRTISRQGPLLAQEIVQVEWVDDSNDVAALASDGTVIVRLGKADPESRNFLRGAILFVRESLLRDAKKHLARSQRSAVDLFVLRALLEETNEDLLAVFDAEFMCDYIVEGEVSQRYEQMVLLSARGLFWDIYLRELALAGQRLMVSATPDPSFSGEVDLFRDFLISRAMRPMGDLVECEYFSTYFRLALVYVGMREKLARGGATWSGYIKWRLVPMAPRTIYLLSRAEDEGVIGEICADVDGHYSIEGSHKRAYQLLHSDGTTSSMQGLVTALRSTNQGLAASEVDLAALRVSVEPAPVAKKREEESDYSWSMEELPPQDFEPVRVSVVTEIGGRLSWRNKRPFFHRSWVHPVATPIVPDQEGLAIFTAIDDRLKTKVLRLKPHGSVWPGVVTEFTKGFGYISVDEDSQPVRFHIRDWQGEGFVQPGMSVYFVPVLTKEGNYRAKKVTNSRISGGQLSGAADVTGEAESASD